MNEKDYFKFRQIDANSYKNFDLPVYLKSVLNDTEKSILDFGCGYGQMLKALKSNGFKFIEGADINEDAIKHLRSQGILANDLNANSNFYSENAASFDFIIMSHVLEHIPKTEVINHLILLKTLLKPNGALIVMVPNAQSNTGCYWAYEDFTHNLLFTGGSLYYVLKAAGFSSVDFLDVDCLAGSTGLNKLLRQFFLRLYKLNYAFWNKITASSFHRPSPSIFSYELKAIARK